jgi:putative PIN family toxin of toxin-antitoxin system
LIAVLDPNVIISALLSPAGAPAQVLRLWLEGAFDLVCSPALLDELSRALTYPKLRSRISEQEARAVIELISRGAIFVDDPSDPPAVRSDDPGDDYLIALAENSRAMLVSGDRDLLKLSDQIPVYSPAQFLALR